MMRRKQKNKSKDQWQRQFSLFVFWVILSVLLVTAGVHTGLNIGMQEIGLSPLVMVHIVLFYWIAVAAGLTLLLVRMIMRAYDEPLQEISNATKRIAEGDFSVQIASTHSDGQINYLNVIVSDINTMARELASIETLKTDFISNVSHELKTPLAVIQNYARLLQSENMTDEEREEYAKAITSATSRMNGLITNILRLNRLENHQLDARRQRFDLGAQLGECLLQFENVWEQKQIDIEVDTADDVMVHSDSELLSFVWNNILSNAFKFTEKGGKVWVSLEADETYAVVKIADTGCGMSEETGKHIFDKFYQGDTSHATQGNGLGLALVKRIIDIVDGEISVSSVIGQGSAFTVRIRRNNDD